MNEIVIKIICVGIGYIAGLFQTAFVYGKMHGIDIREHGSGNSGTTNALRVLGRKAGLIVLLGDCVKTMIPIWIVRLTFGAAHPEMLYLLCLYNGAGAILGHNYPFYLKFRGGKGIAATAGLCLSFHPVFVVVGLTMFFGTFFITHYVSLGSLLVYAGIMIQMVIYGQCGLFGEVSQAVLIEMYVITAFLTLMTYWKHRENIKRLLAGKERKTYLSKKDRQDAA
ncbi:MAG: glycerol-3-phosphate 1-O-acyltransferase PlsY [Clostridium sp.]|jgi:glycerol-3-phosphate acyltransferase PlsY|nr:glycerol-3-phosphate 1-O-acyltransferase PlsY [Clostridium sp.]